MIRIELDNGQDWYFSRPDQKLLMTDGRSIKASEVVLGDKTWFGDYNSPSSHGKVRLIEDVS